jgi:hypothetical protein
MSAQFKLSVLRASINSGHLDLSEHRDKLVETVNGFAAYRYNCVEIDGGFFHKDMDEDGIAWDELNMCHIHYEDAVSAISKRGSEIITHRNNSELIYVNGTYYTEEGIEWADLVRLHDGEYIDRDRSRYVESEDDCYHQDDCYYWESDGEYHLESEPEEEEGKLYDYHNGPRRDNSTTKIKVGFEVEKEDEMRSDFDVAKIFNDTEWTIERDGSLDEETGFELISPVFDLHETNFSEAFLPVAKYLNADQSHRCGGHINYSNELERPKDMAKSISGYFPLLYALYPKRVGAHYCKAKPKNETLESFDKFQAIAIKNDRIEFRIFSAVRSLTSLLWRTELIRIIDQNRTENEIEVLKSMCGEGSTLRDHLLKVFTEDAVNERVTRFVNYLKDIEGVTVTSKQLTSMKKKSK